MAILDFKEKVEYNVNNIMHGNNEAMLGRALNEPFASVNSGSRKLMFSKELEHIIQIENGEKAIVESGYEIRYGDRSSSIKKAKDDMIMIHKIAKFSFIPNNHYYVIFMSKTSRMLYVQERVAYNYITEEFGYLNDTTFLDSLQIGQDVPKDTIVSKSKSFDEFNNRKDGLNLNTVYMCMLKNYEDGIIIDDETAERYSSPILHNLEMMIPENSIPLNIHGNEKVYKVMPDVGEKLIDGLFCSFRPEIKDDFLFSQKKDRLRKPLMSDEKVTIIGHNLEVLDLDIMPNNPELLENNKYFAQYNMYYKEQLRVAQEVIDIVSYYKSKGFNLDYDLQKLYSNSKDVIDRKKYIGKRVYSNIVVRAMILDRRPVETGDKLADRNGGKGVVSYILPKKMMPMLPDGTRANAIINSPTMYGRENPAQCFEVSITHVGRELISLISKNNYHINNSINMIIKYLNTISEILANWFSEYMSTLNEQEKGYYLDSLVKDGYIEISNKPMSESFDIDKLDKLYEMFPQIGKTKIYVPLVDSNGNYRMVEARRETVFGKRYTYRLKQSAKDKFSATSLSSINSRGENAKSKVAANYKAPHSQTCNRLGYQESNDLDHCSTEYVVAMLCIHSTMPTSRRNSIEFLLGDPYDTDMTMDPDGTNRNAEIAGVYLKAIGARMVFKAVRKKMRGAMFHAVKFGRKPFERKQAVAFYQQQHDYMETTRLREEALSRELSGSLNIAVGFKIKPDFSIKDQPIE